MTLYQVLHKYPTEGGYQLPDGVSERSKHWLTDTYVKTSTGWVLHSARGYRDAINYIIAKSGER